MLLLAGILLFVIALPTNNGKKITDDTLKNVPRTVESQGYNMNVQGIMCSDGGDTWDVKDDPTYNAYTEQLEKRLKSALEQIDGVGKVEVMITLKTSMESVVEREKPNSTTSTEEQDAQGGKRLIQSREEEEKVVFQTENGSSTPFVVKTYMPEIEGVLVVAQGAGNGVVKKNLSEIAQNLFAIEANKVTVVKMKTNS